MNIYDKTVEAIRRFNRFYTVNMGFLDSDYLDTQYSIAGTRILFEIKTHGECVQSDIAKNLNIDKSYLSRLIKYFYENGLVKKDKSEEDKRVSHISLTEKGNMEVERLISVTDDRIRTKISKLSPDECDELCAALNTITLILGKEE